MMEYLPGLDMWLQPKPPWWKFRQRRRWRRNQRLAQALAPFLRRKV